MDSTTLRRHRLQMGKGESPKEPPLGRAVAGRIIDGLDAYLADLSAAEGIVTKLAQEIPRDALSDADAVLTGKGGLSYRDGLLIQLAWGLLGPEGYDHTQRGEGARGVGQALGRANGARHIPKVNDAYENIGKNQPNLARGNVAEFDRLLHWMNGTDRGTREALFDYALARVALTARPVLPMPTLRPAMLTFGRVTAFLDDLFDKGSGGAHEQFAVAAFLAALIEQFGFGGVGALNVRTKNINASDASSGTAADVQVLRGGMIDEVFEVSANDWRQKLGQAIEAARRAELSRAHIIAHGDDTADLVELLKNSTVDVSVIDVRSFSRMLCSILRQTWREDALRRLYDYLDKLQPDVELTNSYVRLLRSHSLTAD